MTSLARLICRVLPAVSASVLPLLSLSAPAEAVLPPVGNDRSRLVMLPEEAQMSALPYVITPERRAMLNTIRFAEGTWKGGLDLGYRVMFGGGLMRSLDRHPNRVIYSSRYASAAAGAYQFMPFTWDLVKRSLGVRGFGPEVQDQGALFLIQRRKALSLTDTGVMTPILAAKLAPEWASFPTLRGRSYYGQPVKRFTNLKGFYNLNLAQLRQIRDAKRESLSADSSQTDSGMPKAPVCTGPTILCDMP
ncbi:glycoside hydrolase family 104 protein [Synechococcus sp. W2B2]|uniref:glycoside hydrolase family 24 protein n=1 Tax=unclassified Synechococcus TaxID=2626047 RepID=UPI00006B0B73|nr:glycoside hydrolase family 104 protein [Synechococcus sp. WH 7805]EAR18761.1 possible endolysin [Synechococcus sp. WH 7805]